MPVPEQDAQISARAPTKDYVQTGARVPSLNGALVNGLNSGVLLVILLDSNPFLQ